MKLRIAAALFTLFLVAILVIVGTTAAWFTARQTLPETTAFRVGTLDLAITGEEADPAAYQWEIGGEEGCRDFSWVMKNTGTKRLFLRAKLVETLQETGPAESARGEETPFVGSQGSWAMYFTCPKGKGSYGENNPLCVRLLVGQHIEAGRVEVWEGLSGSIPSLFVRYSTGGG